MNRISYKNQNIKCPVRWEIWVGSRECKKECPNIIASSTKEGWVACKAVRTNVKVEDEGASVRKVLNLLGLKLVGPCEYSHSELRSPISITTEELEGVIPALKTHFYWLGYNRCEEIYRVLLGKGGNSDA